MYTMTVKNIYCRGALMVVAIALAPLFTACDDYMDGDDWVANSEPQLDEYVMNNPDLSLFHAIIRQGDAVGMVHAYGTYTLFAPTNRAVAEQLGGGDVNAALAAITAMDDSTARSIVKYHMLSDTLHTTDLVDSRLAYPNMETDYMTSQYLYDEEAGENYYVINRNARVVEGDIHAGNGILHIVDGFLHRPEYSVTDVFGNINEYAGDGFGKMTGLMLEILNKNEKIKHNIDSIWAGQKYLTVLVQPDEVMEKENLLTVDDVIAALQKNNISNYSEEQLLENWIGYHFLKGRYYKNDIMGISAINTCTSLNKVVTVTTLGEEIYLNRFEDFDDPGIQLLTSGELVDFVCADGVVQTLNGELEIIERAATRINWDMADQPEMRALKGFRKAGTSVYFNSTLSANDDGYVPTDLSMMSWTGKNSPSVQYYCQFEPKLGQDNFDVKSEYVYGDYLNFRLATHVMQYVEIKTPTLVTGKYKVWLRYRAMGTFANGHGTIRTTFKQDGHEDQVFGTVTLSQYGTSSNSRDDDETQLAKGRQQPQAYYPNQTYVTAVNLGTIDVFSDGVHTLRLDATEGNQSLGQNYDMLMFIPIDVDQVHPRVAADGSDSRVYKVTGKDEAGNVILDRSTYIDVAGYNSDYRTHVFPNQCPVVAGTSDPGTCPKAWCPNHDASRFDSEGNLIEQ